MNEGLFFVEVIEEFLYFVLKMVTPVLSTSHVLF